MIDALDLSDPQFRADPYPRYRELRENDPVHWSEAANAWIVTRYDDVRALFTHPACAHWTDSLEGALGRWLWLLNPRSNSRLHELVRPLFTTAAAEDMRGAIAERARTLVQRCEDRDSIDLIADIAQPLTLFVAARLLGVRDEGVLIDDFEALWNAQMQHQPPPPSFAAFAQSIAGVRVQFLGALDRARREGDPIDDSDVIMFAALFLFAAQENIKSFIGNAVLALAADADAWRELRCDTTATEELLRFDTPVQFVALQARDAMTLGGRHIRKGDSLFACIGAANRDPEVFPDPDRLDFQRPPIANLSFGAGAFYCIGAPYARVQTQEALRAMQQSFDAIAVEQVQWKTFPLVLRGPASARISVQAIPIRKRRSL